MKTINVAIIGYGLSGRIFHGSILRTMDNFNIKYVLTSDPNKIKQVRKEIPQAIVASHLGDILSDDSLDLIIISTPNTSHFDICSASLKAGKSVVIEKPFTLTTHDALRLIDLEHDNPGFISVYHNRRFDGDYLTVKSIINEEKLGRLVEFESHFDRFRNTFKENAWREKNLPGSGVLYDLGPHLIDQALNLFGLPQEVYADISDQRRGPVDDAFEIILYYTELKVTLKAGMLVKEPLPRFILHGTQGSFVKYGMDVQEDQLKEGILPNEKAYGLDHKDNWGYLNTEERVQVKTLKGDYSLYYKNIYLALTENQALYIDSQDGFNTMRIIEAAIHSNKLHQRIKFKH